MIAAILLAVCFEQVQEVDRIELHGLQRLINKGYEYEQVIFWDWNSEYRRYDVVAWRLLEPTRLSEYPVRVGDYWQCSWYDADRREEVVVISKNFLHTDSLNDPERASKRLFEEKYRRRLFREICYQRR